MIHCSVCKTSEVSMFDQKVIDGLRLYQPGQNLQYPTSIVGIFECENGHVFERRLYLTPKPTKRRQKSR